jgi:hypothetical protein
VVNWPVIDQARTTVQRNLGDWRWQPAGEARYRIQGDQLMIAVPRALLGMQNRPVTVDFHWVDNIECSGEIEDFFLHGDSAPNRRFDYRYRE